MSQEQNTRTSHAPQAASRPARELVPSARRAALSAAAALALLLFAAAAAPHAQAQTPPGIVGSAPLSSNVAFARLQEINGRITITQPLNGRKNFVFYYEPTPGFTNRSRFLLSGRYIVTLLDANLNPIVNSGVIDYFPNAGFTTSVGAVGFPTLNSNTPCGTPDSPLGIQGEVHSRFGPMFNQTVVLKNSAGVQIDSVPTNGDGKYFFYYNRNTASGFVDPGQYIVETSRTQTTCRTYTTSFGGGVGYFPDSTAGSSCRFVAGAISAMPRAVLHPSRTDTPEFVVNFYQAALGRDPDPWEQYFAVNRLNNVINNPTARLNEARAIGRELFAVEDPWSEHSLRGLTNQQYVEALYLGYLQRFGEPGGVAFWTNNTAQHGRVATRNAFELSGEFSDYVNSLCAGFNPPPDGGGGGGGGECLPGMICNIN